MLLAMLNPTTFLFVDLSCVFGNLFAQIPLKIKKKCMHTMIFL